jgi:hypothetical protein
MPFDCTQLSTAGYFNTWKAATSAAITSYQGKGSTTKTDDNTIILLEQEMLTVSECLSTAIYGLGSTSNDIASLNQQILEKSLELSQAEEDISIAKDRVGYLRNPERNTSPYESWFPIDRPISIFSLILLICICIFMGVFLILLTFSSIGINLGVFLDPVYTAQNEIVNIVLQQFTVSFWIMVIILISIVIYFLKRS